MENLGIAILVTKIWGEGKKLAYLPFSFSAVRPNANGQIEDVIVINPSVDYLKDVLIYKPCPSCVGFGITLPDVGDRGELFQVVKEACKVWAEGVPKVFHAKINRLLNDIEEPFFVSFVIYEKKRELWLRLLELVQRRWTPSQNNQHRIFHVHLKGGLTV